MSSVLRKSSAFTAHEKPTVGDTKTSFVSDDHLGWLMCNGRSVQVSSYGILFGVIGYTFGGSGDSFNLPNAQGRVVGHIGTNSTLPNTTYITGDISGQDEIILTNLQMPIHNHGGFTDLSGAHTHTSNSNINGSGNGLGLMTQSGNNTMNASTNAGAEPDLYAAVTQLVINPVDNHKHAILDQRTFKNVRSSRQMGH